MKKIYLDYSMLFIFSLTGLASAVAYSMDDDPQKVNSNLHQQSSKANDMTTKLISENKLLRVQLQDAKNKLSDKDCKINFLNGRLIALDSIAGSLIDDNKQKSDKAVISLNSYKTKLKDANKLNDDLKKENELLLNQLKYVKDNSTINDEENNKFHSANAALMWTKINLTKKYAKSSEELIRSQQTSNELVNEIIQLKFEMNKIKAENEDLKKALGVLH